MPYCPPRLTFAPIPKRDYQAEDRQRGSRHARGYGTAWDKVAALVKAQEPLCRPCNKLGITRAADEVDHIVPKAQGGTDDRDNLQPICADCHALKTAHERQSYRKG